MYLFKEMHNVENPSVIERIHIFNAERYVKDNTRPLLVLNRNGLFLDGNDNNLKEKANMYDQSVSSFFTIIQKYLKLIGMNNFSKHDEGDHNKHLNVDINDYEKIKRLIFEFAFIACSDHASDEHIHPEEIFHLPENAEKRSIVLAVERSIVLIEQRKLHAIYYVPKFKEYCIKPSFVCITDEELEEKYLLIKKYN
jgi:hypothetical protein